MKWLNNCGTANRKNRRAISAKRNKSRNMKISGKVPTFTYTCKRTVAWRCKRTHIREATRISHTTTHTDRVLTSEKARGEFYIFIPRSPFFPSLASHPLSHPPAGVRTSAQSATPACQPSPAATAVRGLETLFHIQNIPFRVASSSSPRSSLERPGVSLEGIQNVCGSCVENSWRVRMCVCIICARRGPVLI